MNPETPTKAELQRTINRLHTELRAVRQDAGAVIAGLQGDIERLRADGKRWMEIAGQGVADQHTAECKIMRLTEALRGIDEWSRAYPLSAFPEPDLAKAHELLKAGGMTLDAISASAMRHAVEGIGKIARDALSEQEEPDTSDIPEVDEKWFAKARFVEPPKTRK